MIAAPTLPGLTASDPAFESAWVTWIRVTREASGGAHSAHKAAAREEFYRQRRKMPPLPELLAAIEAQGQSERWRAGVIPDFRTWLHQERWNDDPAALKWNGNGKTRHVDPLAHLSKHELAVYLENQAMERERLKARKRRDLGEE